MRCFSKSDIGVGECHLDLLASAVEQTGSLEAELVVLDGSEHFGSYLLEERFLTALHVYQFVYTGSKK